MKSSCGMSYYTALYDILPYFKPRALESQGLAVAVSFMVRAALGLGHVGDGLFVLKEGDNLRDVVGYPKP